MKRMLINATQPEEVRVALVDGQWLYDLDIENCLKDQKKANIYKGKITRIEPSLEAAFVDYGEERHGFLPLKEISREYFSKQPRDIEGRVKIKDVLNEGMEVIVQIDKEERGNKGAALTTFVSLAGRYLVLMPNNPRAGGISRRIDGDERAELKDALSCIDVPKGMGVIVRTAGVGRNAQELQGDLANLINLWSNIAENAKPAKAPSFLFKESNAIIRAIRDYLRTDIGEVIVDKEEAFELASTYIQQNMPNYRSKVKLYEEAIPLFNRYQIEGQIETAFEREVKLPSGGAIVIDVTEALISIDINSSRATKGSDIEETALQTNLEAADEIARQLRLRDMGGLVVIDFIDMQAARNQREVESRMKDALAMDRARVQIGRISPFGLLEMSRQRLRPSLGETTSKVCPRCSGQGTIRGTKSIALSILRLVEEEAQKERSAEIRAICPVPVATYLLNEKRKAISGIESRQQTRIVILPSEEMTTPHFEVQRLRNDEIVKIETSYKIDIPSEESDSSGLTDEQKLAKIPKPLVQQGMASSNPPTQKPNKHAKKNEKTGFLAGLIGGILAFFKSEPEEKPPERKHTNRTNKRGGRNNQNRRRGQNDKKHRDQTVSDNLQRKPNTATSDDKKAANDRASAEGRRNGGRNRRRKTNDEQNADNKNENTRDSQSNESPQNENRPARRPNNRQGRNQQRRRGPRPEKEIVNNESATQEDNKNATQAAHQHADSTQPVGNAIAAKTKSESSPNSQQKDSATPAPSDKINKEETAKRSQQKRSSNNRRNNKTAENVNTENTNGKHIEPSKESSKESNKNEAKDAPIAKQEEKLNQQVISAIETAEHMKSIAENNTQNSVSASPTQLSTQSAAQSINRAPAIQDTQSPSQTLDNPSTDTQNSEEQTQVIENTQNHQVQERESSENKTQEHSEKTHADNAAITQDISKQEKAKEEPMIETPDKEPESSAQKMDSQEALHKGKNTEPNNEANKQDEALPKASEPSQPAHTVLTRAKNDPRVNANPVCELEITNVSFTAIMSGPLDTSLKAEIHRNPKNLERAANDPRNLRTLNNQTGE